MERKSGIKAFFDIKPAASGRSRDSTRLLNGRYHRADGYVAILTNLCKFDFTLGRRTRREKQPNQDHEDTRHAFNYARVKYRSSCTKSDRNHHKYKHQDTLSHILILNYLTYRRNRCIDSLTTTPRRRATARYRSGRYRGAAPCSVRRSFPATSSSSKKRPRGKHRNSRTHQGRIAETFGLIIGIDVLQLPVQTVRELVHILRRTVELDQPLVKPCSDPPYR